MRQVHEKDMCVCVCAQKKARDEVTCSLLRRAFRLAPIVYYGLLLAVRSFSLNATFAIDGCCRLWTPAIACNDFTPARLGQECTTSGSLQALKERHSRYPAHGLNFTCPEAVQVIRKAKMNRD